MVHQLYDVPPGTPGDHVSAGLWILAAILIGTAIILSSKKGGKR